MQLKRPEVEWLINGEPREVQLEALRRSYYGYALRDSRDGEENLRHLRHGYQPAEGWGHLMEMRLGKTPTILNEFALFRRDYDFDMLVVFSPNTYKEDWEAEAEKYGLPVPAWAYSQTYRGAAENFLKVAKNGAALIVNYEALQYDETRSFLEDAMKGKKVMLAADESIKIKNPEGQFYKGAIPLAKMAKARRIATGLPITQGPQDFYSQGRFIKMYDGLNYYAYRNRYCKMGGFKNKKIVGVKNEEQLQKELDANTFIAKRKDWGNQTKAEFYIASLKLAPEQQKHYNEIDKEFITWLDDGTEVAAEQVMSKLMKMQQISSGFVYTEDGRAVEIMDPKKTPKMKWLLERLEDEVPGKVVIPYHYAKSGSLLMEVLAKYNPATIQGDTHMTRLGLDVISEKAKFNNDPSCRVMVLQLSAGKYGHDLSGNVNDRCATMMFFENNYSLDDRTQIEARNTTAFQTWDNLYFDVVSSQVERRAITAQQNKEDIVEAVFGAYRDGKTRVEI